MKYRKHYVQMGDWHDFYQEHTTFTKSKYYPTIHVPQPPLLILALSSYVKYGCHYVYVWTRDVLVGFVKEMK